MKELCSTSGTLMFSEVMEDDFDRFSFCKGVEVCVYLFYRKLPEFREWHVKIISSE